LHTETPGSENGAPGAPGTAGDVEDRGTAAGEHGTPGAGPDAGQAGDAQLADSRMPASHDVPGLTGTSDSASSPPASDHAAATNDHSAISGGTDSPAASSAADGSRPHTMQRGETFSSIAKLVYGNAKYYRQIQEANPNLDPARVRPGTVIKIPDPAKVKAQQGAASGASSAATGSGGAGRAIDAAKEYRVESGDSLYKISVKRFGKPDQMNAIYELNKEAIGSDPARLKVGMVLKMPGTPVATSSR
jgi:nucleoid-associated protein YgaU